MRTTDDHGKHHPVPACLTAEVVQVAGPAAIFRGEWEALADQAMEHHSVRTALLAAQQDTP
jgi:hypothetical protein